MIRKRILAKVLVVAMLLTLFPLQVLAIYEGVPAGVTVTATPIVLGAYNYTEYSVFANGNPIIIKQTEGSSDFGNIYLDKGTVGTYEEGIDELVNLEALGYKAKDTTYEGYDLYEVIVGLKIYGGCDTADFTGNTEITVLSGRLFAIYGGGNSGDVIGKTKVTVKDATRVIELYGGGNTGTVSGQTNLNILGGRVDRFYGGGTDYSATVDSTLINVTGGILGKNGSFYYAGGENGSVTHDTTMNINGILDINWYANGGCFSGNVGGSTTINMTGGQASRLYGAGYSGSVSGSSNINLSGGTVNWINSLGTQSGSNVAGAKNVTISGGNVCFKVENATKIVIGGGSFPATSILGTRTNGAATPVNVYQTSLPTGLAAYTTVSGLSLTGVGSGYGITDIKTIDATGELYLYLPVGRTVASYNGVYYGVNVKANDSNQFITTNAISASTATADANGVTATVSFPDLGYGTSKGIAGDTAKGVITLSGQAILPGTHTVGLTSAADVASITAPATVTKAVSAGTNPNNTFEFTFTMPANAVDDLIVTHSFAAAVETTPTATIDYTNEQLTGLVANKAYTINSIAKTADTSGKLAIESGWLGTSISIVKKAEDATTTDSAVQTLAIPSRPAAPSISGENPIVIGGTGSIINVDGNMEYKISTGSWTAVAPAATSVTGLTAGTYYVRTEATSTSFASADATIIINAFTGSQETIPSAAIDYVNEQLTGLTASGAYTINSVAKTAGLDGKLAIENAWLGTSISIIKKGNGTTTTDSTAQSLTLSARPAAPSASRVNPTIIGGTGSLIDVDDTMEYKINAGDWTAVPATATSVAGLTAGTYYVRTEATATSFASSDATITIDAFTGSQETIPSAAIDYVNEKLTGLTASGTYTINSVAKTAGLDGKLAIENAWLGTSISIIKKGNGTTTTDSTAQSLTIASRSVAPSASRVNPTVIGGTGSLVDVDDTMEYKISTGGWTAVPATATSVNGLTAGTYYVRTEAIASSFASLEATLTITSFGGNAEITPNASVDYANEKLTGLTPSVVYIVGSTEYTSTASGTIAILDSWFGTGIYVVKKGNSTTTTNSDSQSITLAARSATPTTTNFIITQPTASGALGTIAGITASMEYSTNGGIIWTNGTGDNITETDGTTVRIRIKATNTTPSSLAYNISLAYTPSGGGGGNGGGGASSTVTKTIVKSGEEVNTSNLSKIVSEKNNLTVKSDLGTMVFDTKALSAINDQTTSKITIVIEKTKEEKLSNEQKTIVGDRPVYDLTVLSGSKKISDFKGGKATVTIPYELKEGEKPEGVVVWYLADDGTLTSVNCKYDLTAKAVTFTVSHFSKYVVGYVAKYDSSWVNPFTDISKNAWYYEAVGFAYQNEWMLGKTKTSFMPDGNTTRNMIVSILWRMEGQPEAATASEFKDVDANAWYSDAVIWASKNGIVSGYNSNTFAPEDKITREQVAAILYRYAIFKGKDVSKRTDLSVYSDSSKLSSWAKEAMAYANAEGFVSGLDAKTLDSTGYASRAQVAQILKRFVESEN